MDAGPGTPPPEYDPSVVDRVALDLFHRTMSKVVGEPRYGAGGFKGMVRTARLLSTKYNSASKTKAQARMVYHRLLPPGFPTTIWFRGWIPIGLECIWELVHQTHLAEPIPNLGWSSETSKMMLMLGMSKVS